MGPLESTIELLRNIIDSTDSYSVSDFTLVDIDPDFHDLYKHDLEILVKLKELIAGSSNHLEDNIGKLMKGELSIICPKDEKTIHDAMGLCRDILIAVNKWL